MEFYFIGIGSIIIGFLLGILKHAIKDYLKYRTGKETISFESCPSVDKFGNDLSKKRLEKQIGKLKHNLISEGYTIAEQKETGGFLRRKKIFIKLVKN